MKTSLTTNLNKGHRYDTNTPHTHRRRRNHFHHQKPLRPLIINLQPYTTTTLNKGARHGSNHHRSRNNHTHLRKPRYLQIIPQQTQNLTPNINQPQQRSKTWIQSAHSSSPPSTSQNTSTNKTNNTPPSPKTQQELQLHIHKAPFHGRFFAFFEHFSQKKAIFIARTVQDTAQILDIQCRQTSCRKRIQPARMLGFGQ